MVLTIPWSPILDYVVGAMVPVKMVQVNTSNRRLWQTSANALCMAWGEDVFLPALMDRVVRAWTFEVMDMWALEMALGMRDDDPVAIDWAELWQIIPPAWPTLRRKARCVARAHQGRQVADPQE